MHVDEAALCAARDRGVEIKLLGRAFARETAEPAQRDLHRTGPESLVAVEVLKIASVPDFHRAAMPAPVLADPDALRVLAIGAEGRGPGRADPFRAALMAAFLLGEPLAQRLHQLLEAQGLQLGALLRR